ncbi:HipA domain-containing protein [Neiella sp. HB171785]|uniref:HipA domain-containing protein n=1 Tax=Neiella litorisoli TaxID=2771431 RepID=A0A8J6QKS8_9GAMM|nr:HipA domain-containing protein [Neiella litorisoli]MBD1390131.1 HipA domain-containing protein [Neiella litorisoli]
MPADNIDQPSEYTLLIHLADQRIGTLTLDRSTNLLKLEYEPDWQQSGYPLSPALTLDNLHSPEVAYNYLDNVLPEGAARKLLSEHLGVSEKNVYSQVRAIGNDLAGAITFKANEQGADISPKASEPQFRVIEPDELTKRLASKEDIGLLTWDDKPRLSVAGVQDKLNIFINEQGQIGFGDGALCSTHILKFEKHNCPNLVLNEYFCMKLSKAVGLPTAEVEFTRFEQYPALIVERFDRKYVSDQSKVFRRHVIDGCQALNLPRDYKYERNLGDGRDVQHIRDGASLPRLFQLAKTMTSPVESLQWLINWQLFNLLISNYDSHGKNVSLFFDKRNNQFTPAYDLVNIAMFPQFKHILAMAMAMGDEFEPESINAYQLADFAETCGVNKKLLSRQLTVLANKVIETLSQTGFIESITQEAHFTEVDLKYMTAVKEHVLTRAQHLRSQAPLIPDIEV